MTDANSQNRKYIKWVFLPPLIAMGVQIVAVIMLSAMASVVASAAGTILIPDGDVNTVMNAVSSYLESDIFSSITTFVYMIVTTVIMIVLYKKLFAPKVEDRWFQKKATRKGFTIVGVLVFTISVIYVCNYLVDSISSAFPAWKESYDALMESAGFGTDMSVAALLHALLLAPIVEEIIFRGVTFSAARKVMPVWAAIVIQAVLFAVFHMNPLQSSYVFVLAIGLGYIMYLYDNILITIAVHMLFNVVGSVGAGYLPMGGNTLPTYFLCLLAALIALYLSCVCLKKGVSKVNIETENADI